MAGKTHLIIKQLSVAASQAGKQWPQAIKCALQQRHLQAAVSLRPLDCCTLHTVKARSFKPCACQGKQLQ